MVDHALFLFREREGITVVMLKEIADQLKIKYTFESCWISLNVFSDLEVVGLTATIATSLSQFNIPCNVVAGYHHDHLFVPAHSADQVIKILSNIPN